MSEKQALRKALAKLLEQHRILPYTEWKKLEIRHENSKPTEDNKKLAYGEIRKNVRGIQGVYVYEKNGKVLYVGRGSELQRRLKRHYRESFINSPHYGKTHRAFFFEHTGKLRVYWKEYGDEESRRAYEGMMIFVLQPLFESFRESRKRGE